MTLTSDKRIPVHIDCDPGADDFFALIWAMIMHKRWYIDIVWISTSGGNVPAQATFDNVIRAMMMMWVDTKVWKWYDKQGASNAGHIHGNDGIGWLSSWLPDVIDVEVYDSVALIRDSVATYGTDLRILAMWPLSNFARLEHAHPWLLKKSKELISMGGAFYVSGNVTPKAEFNYWYDPSSVLAVLQSWVSLSIIPLDVTNQYIFGRHELEPILSHVNHEVHRDFLKQLTDFNTATNQWFRQTKLRDGFIIHDANTVWLLLYPQNYRGSFLDVSIDTRDGMTQGQILVDQRNFPRVDTNAYVVLEVDVVSVLEAMTEDFKEFDFINKEYVVAYNPHET